jgi:hypothetical protein
MSWPARRSCQSSRWGLGGRRRHRSWSRRSLLPPLTLSLPLPPPPPQVLELGGWRLLVTHVAGRPGRLEGRAAQLLREHRPDVVVCGHSHVPLFQQLAQGAWLANPGSAGAPGAACRGPAPGAAAAGLAPGPGRAQSPAADAAPVCRCCRPSQVQAGAVGGHPAAA